MRRLGQRIGLALATLAVGASPSLACAVCFGAADDPMVGAVRGSILFLLGLTYVVIGGGVALAIVLRRHRSRSKEGAHGETARTA